MQIKKKILAMLVAVTISSFVHAQNQEQKPVETPTQDTVQKAQNIFKATFSKVNVSNFLPSPIPGIFEIHTAGGILYFYAPHDNNKGVLIFGEMYDSDGNNLTQLAKLAALKQKWDKLDLSTVITIGDKNAPEFWEITDPDCPYCIEWHKWIKDFSKENKIKRNLIFFLNPGHPNAPKKIEHIICSKDKEKAVDDMYEGNTVTLTTCPEAKDIISKHQKLVNEIGANGTPSFVFLTQDKAPDFVTGFTPSAREKITKLVKEEKSTSK
ncbi:DsbC family protein [Pectobacterium versatile]|uniref:DsbC family protein n=1 Tax=Pectobacterium versatile TaxID=2488639 RepID=UPI001F2888E1|nr:DsbC family protein [Pectobacterium versatile]